MPQEKQSVTAEKAVKILKENGTIVTLEEAQIVLELMYKMDKLAIISKLIKDEGLEIDFANL